MTETLPRRAYLGAELPDDREAFSPAGVQIARVLAGSMASRAGLQPGDVLVTLADRSVRDLRELAAALRCAGTSGTTPLVYLRDGREHRVQVDVVAVPRAPHESYAELAVARARLRTIATQAATPRALIVVVQGIACESSDHALERDAPVAMLVDALTTAGYSTLRFDKRGVGDSEGGPCNATDFVTELADARAVVEHAHQRGLPVVLFGHSVGGIIAAQLAEQAAAVVVYGTPVMRWLDCLLDSTARQLALRGASADDIAGQLDAIRALAQRGELNGRSAAYHAQLHALDSEAAWRAVAAPVLVLRGEHDWVVRADDAARIAALARGPTTIADLPGLDHVLGWHPDRAASLRDYGSGRSDRAVADATVAWLGALPSLS